MNPENRSQAHTLNNTIQPGTIIHGPYWPEPVPGWMVFPTARCWLIISTSLGSSAIRCCKLIITSYALLNISHTAGNCQEISSCSIDVMSFYHPLLTWPRQPAVVSRRKIIASWHAIHVRGSEFRLLTENHRSDLIRHWFEEL